MYVYICVYMYVCGVQGEMQRLLYASVQVYKLRLIPILLFLFHLVATFHTINAWVW